MPDLKPGAQQMKQCQHCHKSENLPDFHLRSCSRCSRAHYCNRECQVADYKNHKAACRNNAAMLERIKGLERLKEPDSGGPAVDRKKIESRLKQWIQVHRPLLITSIINALELQRTPERCRTDTLLLILEPNFSSKNPAQYFTVARTMVSELEDNRQLMVEQLGAAQGAALSRILVDSQRIGDKGGVGIPVVFIIVPVAGIAHLTPFELPELVSDMQSNEDWEAFLKEMVERGTTV